MNRQGVRHLHNHFANSGATVGMLAAHFAELPWSLTVHGISETDYPAGALLAEKVKRATFVACASYFMRAQAMRFVADDQWAKMHIVRCGIDLSTVPDRPAAHQTKMGDPPQLICVGRLSPEKGYPGLFAALAGLAAEGLDFSLTIVGDGPAADAIRADAKSQKLEDHIRFAGSLPESATLVEMAKADIFVLPSLMEGLPVVCQTAFKRDPRSASKKDPLADMMGVC
ncbi:glycosyltransferase [Sphingopyxis sp.]|uniref:glycosyltransferase n=1 Tax=Sphingopyxis sp. TaxID=1908224 RepID=UPI003BADA124